VTSSLGAQGTVCAGGRFDGLIEQLGGKATPAVGFAMGMERLVLLLDDAPWVAVKPLAYIIHQGEAAKNQAMRLVERLRDELPTHSFILHCGDASLKSQFKKADKVDATFALVLGESEVENQHVGIKFLRERKEQEQIPQDELINFLTNNS